MDSTRPSITPPPCPLCGSRSRVVRMATSLTPWERPWMREGFEAGHFYCQACAHDFEPQPEDDTSDA